ncbi:MAG: hypothetical protein WCF10_10520 [Polyangiales bacterium]
MFGWSDQWLIRWGGEYRIFNDQWPLRLGFIYGSASTSASFPNCGGPGQYALKANHFLFDFSSNWR